MKATDLFLLINEIDERLIDDAENDVQPEKIVVKGGLPFKEIVVFAACFAALAVGIFAIIKFKINGDLPTVSNDPITTSSSCSSDESSYNESDNSNESTVSDPEKPVKDPDMVKDTAFSHIIQPYLKKGSLADTLRGIMLRAVTVEELEAKIHEADTENKVTEILVTMPAPWSSGVNRVPYTSGEIVDSAGMQIDVTYTDDEQPDKRTGITYVVGKFFDEYYGQIISEGDFVNLMMSAAEQSLTVEDLHERLAEVDFHDRINEIHVFTDSERTNEITSGALENGMVIYVNYDNVSWFEGAVYGRGEGGIWERFWQLDIDPWYIGLERISDISGYAEYSCEPVGMMPFASLGVNELHFGFINGFGDMVFVVEPTAIAGKEVQPIANNFEDFLRVVLASKNAGNVKWIYWLEKDEYESLVAESGSQHEDDPAMSEIYRKTEEALAVIQNELGLESMPDAYDYVRGIQSAFNYSKIRYSDNYYEMTGLDKPE